MALQALTAARGDDGENTDGTEPTGNTPKKEQNPTEMSNNPNGFPSDFDRNVEPENEDGDEDKR